jgi:hypothetical protein
MRAWIHASAIGERTEDGRCQVGYIELNPKKLLNELRYGKNQRSNLHASGYLSP